MSTAPTANAGRKIWRTALGALAGLVTALAALAAVEAFSAAVHPFPAGFSGTHEEVCAHVARYPVPVLAAVVPMWGFAALAATWVARKLGRRPAAAMIAGGIVVAALAANLAMLPYPWWFRCGALAAVVGGAWFGGR